MGHFNRIHNKISRILQLRPAKDNSFCSISQDGTIRHWDMLDNSSSKIVDLRISMGNPESMDALSLQNQRLGVLTAFDYSDELYIAVGVSDGTLQVL